MSESKGGIAGLLGTSPPTSGLGIGGNALAAALGLGTALEARGLYYNNKQIKLDGYRFIECRFDNCVLVVHSTNFAIERCIIDERCSIMYGNSLIKVIQLFTSRYSWLADQIPSLAPVRNPDGSVSIGV